MIDGLAAVLFFASAAVIPPERVAGEITDKDYPKAAIKDRLAGTVAMALAVNADGLIESCRIARSSGHAALDDASCPLMLARFRFRPARDEEGKPTASDYEQVIRWVVPKELVPGLIYYDPADEWGVFGDPAKSASDSTTPKP